MSKHPSPGQAVPINTLLRIDVQAGIRKLSDAQLQGSWQLGAECVRLAVQCQAQSIKVVTGRKKLSITASGAALPIELMADLAKILDDKAPPQARHAALVRLEASQHPVLLVLLSQAIDAMTLTSQQADGRHRLVWKRGEKPQRLRQIKELDERSLQIELKIRDLNRRTLSASLFELCRFCWIPLKIDGRACHAPLAPGLGQCRISEPIPGMITLPSPGAGSRVWLLQDGVIRANLSLPDRPWFVAALELSSKVRPDASPADLRGCFERELPGLIQVSIALLRRSVHRSSPTMNLAPLRHWVLQAARIPELLRHVESLAVFPLHGPKSAPQMRSLADLAEDLAQLPSRQLRCATIDPRDLAGRVHHDTPLLEIESRAQPLLCELLQHRYSAAPALTSPPVWALLPALARLRTRLRAQGGLRSIGARLWTKCLAYLVPTPPDTELPSQLREALAELQLLAAPKQRVEITKYGSRAVWRGNLLLLPVGCPELRHWAALRAQHEHAKELLWSSLCALPRSPR